MWLPSWLCFVCCCCTFLCLSGAADAQTEPTEEVRIAILGNSSTENNGPPGFNEEVLGRLLNNIKRDKAEAVFFLGNMVSGVEKTATGYAYSNDTYRKELATLHGLVIKKLGATPFYPVAGEKEIQSTEALGIFRNEFSLQKAITVDHGVLLYTVAIGNAYFVVLQTNYFDTYANKVVSGAITSEWLDWLDKDLKEKSSYYPYLFVFGYDPAFSSGAPRGEPSGLDKDIELRDLFWDVLKKNQVLAYFSGQDNFFDRTLRNDVWQVISGGAGAPLRKGASNVFQHYLLLIIPQGKTGVPVVYVMAADGEMMDSFELTRTAPTIFQMRISSIGWALRRRG